MIDYCVHLWIPVLFRQFHHSVKIEIKMSSRKKIKNNKTKEKKEGKKCVCQFQKIEEKKTTTKTCVISLIVHTRKLIKKFKLQLTSGNKGIL